MTFHCHTSSTCTLFTPCTGLDGFVNLIPTVQYKRCYPSTAVFYYVMLTSLSHVHFTRSTSMESHSCDVIHLLLFVFVSLLNLIRSYVYHYFDTFFPGNLLINTRISINQLFVIVDTVPMLHLYSLVILVIFHVYETGFE